MRNVAILGSTGSIGTQALDVIARFPERFRVVALAAGKNVALLERQVEALRSTQGDAPAVVSSAADGPGGLMRAATESGADIVLAATDGAVAFDAVFEAVRRGIDLAVANKELIVAAGELLVAAARESGSQILPVDSEHSAIFQCLVGEDPETVSAIVLTASGGPFRGYSAEQLATVTLAEALAHPTWRMGTKNTIDSATMMNKGLEIIEASHLFGIDAARLHILVHPQSIAHGFVAFTDGSVKGQLCAPDMRVPIGYALAYPRRLVWHPERSAEPGGTMDDDALHMLGARPQEALLRLDFERPDPQRFPCIALAYRALERGGIAPAVLSAANELAVAAFAGGAIRFVDIPGVIEAALEEIPQRPPSLDGIREADREARQAAQRTIEDRKHRCSVS